MTKHIRVVAICLLILTMATVISACENTDDTASTVVSSKPTVNPEDTVITSSSLMIPFTLDDMIEITDAAVIGMVVEILPAEQAEREGTMIIYTDVVIEPERYLYGEPQTELIVVRVDEGRIGDIVMTVEGEAEFILGEECAVFLIHPAYEHTVPEGFSDESYYVPWAGLMSKYEIQGDTLIDALGTEITLSEVEQRVALIRVSE